MQFQVSGLWRRFRCGHQVRVRESGPGPAPEPEHL